MGEAGANYGWGEREGTRMGDHGDARHCLGLPWLDALRGYAAPTLVYGHHLDGAVTGGHVHRGNALPQLRSMYVFGDTVSGCIFLADAEALPGGGQAAFYELPLLFRGEAKTFRRIVGAPRADLRFGLDDRGELYVLTKQGGMIRRLAGLGAGRSIAECRRRKYAKGNPTPLFEGAGA